MDMWQRITAAFVLVAPLIVIGYDIAVFVFVGEQATISSVVRQWSRQWHDLPYVIAGLFVWLWLHLFFEVIVNRHS
jgi:hypothetical protein